jgi:hypothetical protein
MRVDFRLEVAVKNAHLWKRILNEGLGNTNEADFASVGSAERLVIEIIKAPLIVCSVLGDKGWVSFKRDIVFPFDKFWMEGSFENGTRTGAMIEVKRDGNVAIATVGHFVSTNHPVAFIATSTIRTVNGRIIVDEVEGKNAIQVSPVASVRDSAPVLDGVRSMLDFVISNLELLACKNVGLEKRDNEPKQVARAIKRHGGNADSYRYHVLVVRPAGAKSDAPAQEIGIMPRHVCRGHFAEYGPEFNKGLLFGKYAGRFFVPPHMKGDKKNGEVVKDYEVPA